MLNAAAIQTTVADDIESILWAILLVCEWRTATPSR